MARATPYINDGVLTYRDAIHEHTIAVGGPLWWQWLAAADTTRFRFEHPVGELHGPPRTQARRWYWYAYRTRDGALQKAYLGRSPDLTLDRLLEVAAALAQGADATPCTAPLPREPRCRSRPPATACPTIRS